MKTLQACTPRKSVLDGTADFVVNLADLPQLSEAEAREFLDSNVLTSGMELLLQQAFARMGGEKSASGIYKLSESMGGGKTQSMIVAGILARHPKLADLVGFRSAFPKANPEVVASFTGRSTDQKVWVSIGKQLGVDFPADRAPSEAEWRDALKVSDQWTTPLTVPLWLKYGNAEFRSAGCGRHQAPGQQRLEIVGGGGAWQRPEEGYQVLVGVDAIGLAGFDERVEVGAGVGAAHRIGEEPIATLMESFP